MAPPTCALWLEKKRRFCHFARVDGYDFCGHHLASKKGEAGQRCACPLDPRHSVFVRELKRHLCVCPRAKERRVEEALPCFYRDINAGDAQAELDLEQLSDQQLERLAQAPMPCGSAIYGATRRRGASRLEGVSADDCIELLTRVSHAVAHVKASHSKTDRRREAKHPPAPDGPSGSGASPGEMADSVEGLSRSCGRMSATMKHGSQNAAIASTVQALGLLGAQSSILLELGAGKGGLSAAIVDASPAPGLLRVVLVDRMKPRRSFDIQIRDKTAALSRIKIDLRHLLLMKMPEMYGCSPRELPIDDGAHSPHCALSLNGDDETGCPISTPVQPPTFGEGPPSAHACDEQRQQQTLHRLAVAKHLCGEATDFALRCIVGATSNETYGREGGVTVSEASSHRDSEVGNVIGAEPANLAVDAILIATCCHHRCSWPTYVNQAWFVELGFSAHDFELMTIMSSWATSEANCQCAKEKRSRRPSADSRGEACSGGFSTTTIATGCQDASTGSDGRTDETAHCQGAMYNSGTCAELRLGQSEGMGPQASEPDASHSSEDADAARLRERLHERLTAEDRFRLGRQCKRLLDVGRLQFLEDHGYSAWAEQYCNQSVSPENVLLIATRHNCGGAEDLG